jgi:hypothetical protein
MQWWMWIVKQNMRAGYESVVIGVIYSVQLYWWIMTAVNHESDVSWNYMSEKIVMSELPANRHWFCEILRFAVWYNFLNFSRESEVTSTLLLVLVLTEVEAEIIDSDGEPEVIGDFKFESSSRSKIPLANSRGSFKIKTEGIKKYKDNLILRIL